MTTRLREDAAWAFGGNVVYAGCQFVLLSMLTKVGSATMAGDYGLALALTTPLVLLGNLKLRQVLATDAKGEFPVGAYLGVRLVAAPLPVLGAVGGAWLYGLDAATLAVVVAVGLAKAAESTSDVAHGLFIRRRRLRLLARSQILRGLTALAGVATGLFAFGSLAAGCAVMAGAWAVLALVDQLAAARLCTDADPWRPQLDPGTATRLVRTAAPLGVVTMLGSVQANLPRYALELWWGREAVGVWSCLAALLMAGNTVIGAIGQAATPRLADAWQSDAVAGFVKLLGRIVALGATLGVAAIGASWAIGRPVLAFLFDPSVAAHAPVLVIVATTAAVVWSYVFMGTAINAMRRFAIQLPIHLVNLTVTALAALLLIPSGGLAGAAWAVLCGAVAVLLLNSTVVGLAVRGAGARARG